MRTKEMKNNKTMRTGVILAAIAIITLIALIMTFAKYASQGTGEDNARVAKWGLNVNENLDLKLFSSSYKDPLDQSVTVDASDDASVVAPGTSQQAEVQLGTYSGQAPEVMYHFEPTLTITNLGSGEDLITKLNENDGFTWTLKVNDRAVSTYNTTDEISAAVANLGQKDIAPNTYPTNFGPTDNPKITIGWAWDFNNGGDQSDTELGNLIANNNLKSMQVVLGIKAYQCQGCSTPTENVNLSGTVTTSNGDTVSGATVTYNYTTANGSSSAATTDENGVYKMSVPKNSSGTLNVKKDNYTSPADTTVPQLSGDTVINVSGLNPQTCKVTFTTNPAGSADIADDEGVKTEVEVPYGTSPSILSDNTLLMNDKYYYVKVRTGYTFNSWMDVGPVYKDRTFTVLCDFSGYTVTFKTDGNTKVNGKTETFTVDKTTKVKADGNLMYIYRISAYTFRSAEANSGYTFDGWYYTKDGVETKIEGELDTYEGLEITAKSNFSGYTATINTDEYTAVDQSSINNVVSYYVNDDNDLTLTTTDGGQTITATAKEGYTFKAWYIGDEEITPGSSGDLEGNTTFKATSEISVKPIVTTVDGTDVAFLPAFEEGAPPGDFYALIDGEYIKLSNNNMQDLAQDIYKYGAENVYTNATNATFYGTINKKWTDVFISGTAAETVSKGLNSAFISVLNKADVKTVYFANNDDTEPPEEGCGNWDIRDDSDGTYLGEVDYSDYQMGYSQFLSELAYTWTSRNYFDDQAYYNYCGDSIYFEDDSSNEHPVVLTKTF